LPDVRGTVTAFDREVGLGVITRDDGWVVPFHCIVIADGTRDIPVGADVEFELMGKLGRYEADHVVAI
jgi:cold shock CspA family protein